MKKLLLLFAITSPVFALAQKIESEEVDKFNGIKSIKTSKESLVTSMGATQVSVQGAIYAEKEKSDKVYILSFVTRAVSTGSLKTDESSITLLLDDGAAMELKYIGKYDLFSAGDPLVIYSNVTKDQLNTLSTHKVTDVRVRTSYTFDYKVKEKKQDVVSSISKLLLAQ